MPAQTELPLDEDGEIPLPLEQARRFVAATTAIERTQIQLEVMRAGTSLSLVRDLRCSPRVKTTLSQFMRHCRKDGRDHSIDDVALAQAVYGTPAEPSDVDDNEPVVPAAVARRRAAAYRERLLDDPDVRRRTAGIGGEVYRPDNDEES